MRVVVDTVREIPSKVKRYRKISMTTSQGPQIQFSPAHPFWVVGKGWSVFDTEEALSELVFSVQAMRVGDTLLVYEKGELVPVTIMKIVDTGEWVEMYNVESVERYHSFFANNILVHNKRL
ncbi:hypothetical protein [Neolewinella agarilytica]|nr:hypothetical protein [Neolewinella agarilytica]